ncbi:MAG TPA: HupE/UreJ family protein [Thermoanaerobaculia bacterium]|nr:HupE/UreJ family protein [Thermoanaerobaculia bacterium]
MRGARGAGSFLASAVMLVAGLFALAGTAGAHEVRPGYLSIGEREDGRFDVLFKVPASVEARLALEARLPAACRELSHPARLWEHVTGATIERWLVDCGEEGLEAGEIAIGRLELTLTDVLLRVEWRDGSRFSALLRPEAPAARAVRDAASSVPVAGFLRLGIEHILLGIDHLLFVLCLVLLVEGTRRLLLTITAFTLAHSVTLALATLGVVHVPSGPVEATIALSIVFLALELVRRRRGGEESLTARRPWLVAFAFGLLHGLGFAGALSEIGLPEGDIPLALFLFNVGVEVGQVAFVAVALAALAAGRAAARRVGAAQAARRWMPLVPAYAIGSVAAAWLLERVAAML